MVAFPEEEWAAGMGWPSCGPTLWFPPHLRCSGITARASRCLGIPLTALLLREMECLQGLRGSLSPGGAMACILQLCPCGDILQDVTS